MNNNIKILSLDEQNINSIDRGLWISSKFIYLLTKFNHPMLILNPSPLSFPLSHGWPSLGGNASAQCNDI